MNGVFIVPTGIGAEIGGHAGDATPAAKLIAACCDILLIHPNVVNASDINEMTANMWYVEGSILDRFLERKIRLKKPLLNKVLLATNAPLRQDTVNAVNAARVTIGADIEIVCLDTPLTMSGHFTDGRADGSVTGVKELVAQVAGIGFDALALHTPIDVPENIALSYYRNGGINPWGGVEAIASRMVADRINKPVAHAPQEREEMSDELRSIHLEGTDPRIAPEAVSICYLHCVLKGLHSAPRIDVNGLNAESDIDFMVTPYGCVGRPHWACMDLGIPVIVVRENTTCLDEAIPNQFIIVDNYVEAAGYIMALNAGVALHTIRRPIDKAHVW